MLKRILEVISAKLSLSVFIKDAATVAGGTGFAQSVSLVTAPVLYRIYDKEAYGTLGLYIAILGLIGVFSTMAYQQTILVEKNDQQARRLLAVTQLINVVISFVILVVILTSKNEIGRVMNNEAISNWLILLPVSVFFSGQNQILGIWANRARQYRLLSTNAILTALLVPIFSISIGILYDGFVLGLFVGLLVSHIIPPIVLGYRLKRVSNFAVRLPKISIIKQLLYEYRKFPMFTLPANLINRLINQLPVLMLSAFTTPSMVGAFNLTVRMLGLPINLIANAIGIVFRERAAKDYSKSANCLEIYKKTFFFLFKLSVVPFLFLFLFAPWIFEVVFGEEWRISGEFARVLTIMYFLKLIVPPLAFTFILRSRQQEDFYWHIWMLVSNTLIFYFGFVIFDSSVKNILLVYALNYSMIYLIYLFRSYSFAKGVTFNEST